MKYAMARIASVLKFLYVSLAFVYVGKGCEPLLKFQAGPGIFGLI